MAAELHAVPKDLAASAPISPTMAQVSISCVPDIIAEIKAGRMVILVDEEDRENEGDLVMAADCITPEAINFMAKFGRGLICLTLSAQRCERLALPLMVQANGSSHGTNFTLSIEAATGVSTGISAADRARTVQAAVNKHAVAADIVQPGHIFPLRAQDGGVLMRAGHTEAGCDLTRMAGFEPASVICEIMNDDGTMARLPDLMVFAATHHLKIGSIADLIAYRSANECLVEVIGEQALQTEAGEFACKLFRDKVGGGVHLALVRGQIRAEHETLVRVHEPLSVMDLLETQSTTHSYSLPQALRRIAAAPSGVLVLLNAGESGAQLTQQFEAVAKSTPPQSKGRMDLRTYGVGAQILRELGVRKMRLLSKPRKMPSMQGFALDVTGYAES